MPTCDRDKSLYSAGTNNLCTRPSLPDRVLSWNAQNKWKERATRTWVKILIVTVLIAVPAIMLGPIIWPNPEGAAAPTAAQMPYFLLLALWEGVLLGLGGLVFLFGWPVIRRVSPDSRVRACAREHALESMR
jgi:hypothetical protein